MKLRPSQIRFMQDSISSDFKNGQSVNERAVDLARGNITPKNFPTIRVVKKNGVYYSFDNRRLYIFRYAELRNSIEEVEVKKVSPNLLNPSKFTTKNHGREIVVRNGTTLNHYREDWLTSDPVISTGDLYECDFPYYDSDSPYYDSDSSYYDSDDDEGEGREQHVTLTEKRCDTDDRLEEANQQRADHRTWHRPEAAEQGNRQPLDQGNHARSWADKDCLT